MLALLISSAVLSGLLILLSEQVGYLIGLRSEYELLYYAAGILTLDALSVVPFAELRLANRPWLFATIKMTNILVNVGLNVWLILGLGWGIEAIFVANMAASGVALLMLAPIIWKRWASPSKELMRKMLIFGLPFVPGGLGYALAERLNIFFLSNLDESTVRRLYGDYLNADALILKGQQAAAAALAEGKTAAEVTEAATGVWGDYVVGIFGTGWKLGIFLVLVVQMFRFAWQPFFLQHAEDPDAKPLFARIFTLLTAGLVLAVLAISFLADDLVRIPLPGDRFLIGPAYWFSITIVPLALVAYFFQGWYYLFSAGLYLTEKTKYLIHATFAGSAASIVLNLLLTTRFGMVGAAWSTVGAYAVMTVVLYFITQRFYPMTYDWKRVGAVCALGLGLFALWSYLPVLNAWYVEVGLVLIFGAALIPIGIIPPTLVKRLLKRA